MWRYFSQRQWRCLLCLLLSALGLSWLIVVANRSPSFQVLVLLVLVLALAQGWVRSLLVRQPQGLLPWPWPKPKQ